MKFALIVFLGICALSVQASTTLNFDKEVQLLEFTDLTVDGIFDKLKEFLDKLVNKVTETIADIIEKFNNTVANVVEKVKAVVQKALDKFQSIRQKIEDKLKEFEEQSAIARECSAKHAQEIMGTLEETKNNIETCMTTAEAKLEALTEKVQPKIDAIREKVAVLAGIFTKCVDGDNKLGTVLCVLKDAKVVIESINTLVESAKDLVEIAQGEGADLIKETSECVGVAYDAGQEKLDALMAEVEKCIEEANQPSFLLH